MPSNSKRCKSLRGVLLSSGDMVLHHFANYWPRSWPTKMPTRMLNGLQSCKDEGDLVRCWKARCSSLIAKKRGVAARLANKLWKPCFDRPRASSKFVRLLGMYILMPHLQNKLRASQVDCRIALVTLARDYRRICRRKKPKTRCWVVVLKKIGIRGVIQII